VGYSFTQPPTDFPDDPVFLWWTLAISASFRIGSWLLVFVPGVSAATWTVGIVSNVVMAVGVGIYLGWTHRGVHIPIAMVLGAVVTTFGVDLLVLVSGPSDNARFGLSDYAAFDSLVAYVALSGMVILVGGGALAGVFARLMDSRSDCDRLFHHVDVISVKGDSHEVKDRDLWSVPTDDPF
jgi:hypothetical protein